MALVRFGSPWPWFREMEREMTDLVRRAFGTEPATPFSSAWPGGWTGRSGQTWLPAVDVFSRGSELVVRAELPGVDPEKDVEITYQDGILTIRGERRREERSGDDRYWRVESSYGAFERSVPLPDGVKADDITATHKDGILEVVVPKAGELAPAKRIPIKLEAKQRKVLPARDKK